MCRWLAYTGSSVNIEHLILQGTNSIVTQSLTSHLGAEPTNGDGFGVGWWADGSDQPSRYRSTEPAWNDINLRDITNHLYSRMTLTHVRAAIGSPVQLNNCHPFQHDEWLFVHNGYIGGYDAIRRQLLIDVDPKYFNDIGGTADSEVLFYLAMGYGLPEHPQRAMELATGHVEQAQRDAGIEPELQLSIGFGNGTDLYALRYSPNETPRTLFHSNSKQEVAKLYPDLPRLEEISNTSRMIVSEPLTELEGIWVEIEPSSFVHVRDGDVTIEQFTPQVPAPVAR
jgi:glutamine amidotransferase